MPIKRSAMLWGLSGAAAALVVAGAAALIWQQVGPRAVTVTVGKFPEQLVYVRSGDDIVNGGAMFTPPAYSSRNIAIIWIHGWGANFYEPTYVMIARRLAERGLTTIVANTRMHDLGNVAGWRGDKRIRGGGYWGVASEQARDIAAWINFAESHGFKDVVLVGHSAGWAAVSTYQAEKQDARVVGVVVASPSIQPGTGPTDPDQIAQATRMLADGRGDDLVRDPKRSFPSFISAATMMDIVNSPPELKDFFGTRSGTRNPGITRIRCPLLAFFGTRGDVGGEKDLQLLKSFIAYQASGPSRVDTAIIGKADHMYTGEEAAVARTIGEWINSVVLPQSAGRGAPIRK